MSIKKNTKKFKYKVTAKGNENLTLMGDLGWELVAVDSNSYYFKLEV